MTTCISHWTALHWHLRRVCWSSVMASDGDEPRVPDVGPTAAEVADVMRALEPYLPEVPGRAPSIDVLVASDRGRRKIAGVTSHVCSTPLPRGSIQPTGLRGYDIAVTSPELTFIQIAATEDLRVAAYVGMALCSSFRLDDFSTSGLARREAGGAADLGQEDRGLPATCEGTLWGGRGPSRSEVRPRRRALAT